MFKCILASLTLHVFNCQSFLINFDDTIVENGIISSVISQFEEHNVVFHYENCTKHRVGPIVLKAVLKQTILMQNYDEPSMLSRPDGYSFLHVILLRDPTRFKEFTTSIFSLKYVDVLFFVVNLDADEETKKDYFQYWNGSLLHKAGAMFAFNTWIMQLFTVCFYCDTKRLMMQSIAILMEDEKDNYNISVNLVHIYENQFLDFNRHVFRVGYITYKPFFWCKRGPAQPDKTHLYYFWGPEGWLLVTLIQKLNMRFHMINHDEEENKFINIIEAVQNETLDWAIGGISLTIKRSEHVDFTTEIHNEAFTVLYSVYDDPWLSWMNVILPFEITVWLILILTIVVICILMFIALKQLKNNGDINFCYFIQKGCLRYLVEQPLPHIKKVIRTRWTTMILMSIWITIAMIMTNAYKSKLTSSLITARIKEYGTLDDLVERGYDFYISDDDSSVIEEILESSDDQKFLMALKRSRNDTGICEAILQTAYQKVAAIDEETNFHYSVQDTCRDYLPPSTIPNFRLTRSSVSSTSHAWPMPLNTAFRPAVNRVIAHVGAAGLLAKWTRDFTAGSGGDLVHKSRRHAAVDASEFKDFRLRNMIGPAAVWAVGVAVAAGRFVWEVARGRHDG